MVTVVIDPGHGGTDPGATYKQYKEKDFNLKVALLIRKYLIETYEVKVLMTRSNDETLSLEQRTTYANNKNADFYLSVHHNAAGGSGFESYIYNGSIPSATKEIQRIIHKEIVFTTNKYNVKDRGQKRANFFVLRKTKMNALLLEVLFIDNQRDLQLMLNNQFLQDVAKATAIGLAKALNLTAKPKPLPKPDPNALYKVIAGSFKEEENAKQRALFLQTNKINSYIYPVNINGTTYYRVQAGAFSLKENADELVAQLKSIGIDGAFIVTEGEVEPPPVEPITGYRIMGNSVLTASSMNKMIKVINKSAPELADLYLEIGEKYGIRGDAALAQAIHETNYFRFTGTVKPEQNNYAGIGTTDPNTPGASFASPREGVTAHIQHLYAYASTDPLPPGEKLVDPRFDLVTRGSAPTWTSLNGKWAVPGTTYGQLILSIYENMINFELEQINQYIDLLEKTTQQIKE
ncbi:N-acetylmuramoyl-L-alanine amidase [Pseudalkalibacillus berkeleyi]|uniref:N-acetylmuramoyl-L-alanine amidase n=1 Tax=Pseudalkalibacillus berkeleyi TaxID=1069813 RepID=A0ABS9GXD9_9BACL|nr:N-acetylmuramoyl-L-alanine amidase [Pseudalkalibacillus berkeleyi]MCF6136289.1 N-acetylmuramoyl-L-alanine amidase [Pseudalkalibacillus berkeleyi]